MAKIKNSPPTHQVYVQVKNGWMKDKNAFLTSQRNFFALLCFISFLGIIVAMIVIKSMVEKNAIEPYVVSVNTMDKMPIAISSQSIKEYANANQAIVEFFIIKYVKTREGYNFGTVTYDYDFITKVMSSPNVYRDFRKNTLSDEKTNPVTVLQENGKIEVVVKQITHSLESQIAVLRIAKKIYKGERIDSIINLQVKLHYKIETANLKASDIEVNPLGIIIDSYDLTEEKTFIEDEIVLK